MFLMYMKLNMFPLALMLLEELTTGGRGLSLLGMSCLLGFVRHTFFCDFDGKAGVGIREKIEWEMLVL